MTTWKTTAAEVTVEALPAARDNYQYLITWADGVALIDATEAGPALAACRRLDRSLAWLLLTHHHHDHVAACAELKQATGCGVIGPSSRRIPGLDQEVHDGESLALNGLQVKVLATPGHTTTDVSYYLPEPEFLFCGDTLFVAGCGRLFEGDAETMWRSLSRLAELPGTTSVFCGHEYTETNLRFAETVEPNNPALAEAIVAAAARRRRAEPTVPSTVATERAINPFLRCHTPQVRQALQMPTAPDAEVFAELRRRKDCF